MFNEQKPRCCDRDMEFELVDDYRVWFKCPICECNQFVEYCESCKKLTIKKVIFEKQGYKEFMITNCPGCGNGYIDEL